MRWFQLCSKIAQIVGALANKMIAESTCLGFFCNPCAHAESHRQESTQKLCSATLNLRCTYKYLLFSHASERSGILNP